MKTIKKKEKQRIYVKKRKEEQRGASHISFRAALLSCPRCVLAQVTLWITPAQNLQLLSHFCLTVEAESSRRFVMRTFQQCN